MTVIEKKAQQPKNKGALTPRQRREQKLAKALRDNLRKRKKPSRKKPAEDS